MDYEYQHQPYQATVSSFASAPNSASESAYSKRKSAYLPSTSPPPVPYYQQSHQLDPYQQQQHQSMYLPQHQYHGQHNHQDPYQEQHNQFQSLQQEQLHQYEYQQQQSHRDSQYQEDINMDLDTATGTPLNLASSSKLKPSSLRTLGKREFNSISPPPIMTTPLYGSQKFASSTQSPPPYYAGLPGQDTTAEMNTFNFNHTDVNQRQYQFLSYQPSDSQGHERQQQKQRYFQHYNTAPNTRHNSFSHHQTASQYYQDLPVDSVLPQTGTRAQRPKSLAAHDFAIDHGASTGTGVFVTAGEGGGGEIYPQFVSDTSSRQAFLSAKPRQSISAVIPQAPHTWVEPQQQQQQQEQFPQQQHLLQQQLHSQQLSQKKPLTSRQSFHELHYHQRQPFPYEQQPIVNSETYQQQAQYLQQQQFLAQQDQQQQQQQQQHHQRQLQNRASMDIAQYRTPMQGPASPHHRGQTIGLDIPMSPNPPMTPSITSNSNGSTLTALNSPQNSERGGPGAHLQKSIHVLPSSPPASSHYRKKSFNSGLIPHTLSSERSPMPSQAGSPISTPYGSPPKVASNYMNMLAARKNSLSENPSFNPRDLYRRSESYSALQARAIMNHSNASADLNGTILSSSQTSSRDHTMRPHESLEYDEYNLDAQMAGNHVEIRNEVWREQDQQPPQSHYHRNRSNREKHKRESFYAALQSSDQGAGSNHYDESRKPSKGSSRISSPYNSSGAPQTSTRTKGSIPTTPTAEHKTRPTPPPRSRSRTPAGNTGGNGSQTSLNAPQQPQMPRQYSGEIQPISRKSGMMVDDAMVSFVQRPDTQYSSSSSTPSNQSVEYQPRAGDGVPVPVADITKHLSVLEFKEQNAMAAVPPSDISTPNVHVRKPASSGMVGPHRRSIVFDGVGSSGRSNGTDGGHRLKDGLKERNSMIAGMSLGSSRKRGKTLSAMDPPKAKPAPAILPPMYMSTTSRTNVPSPMATRMAGSKIPSPYGGRKGTATPRDAASASNSRLLAVDATSGVVTQDVKTIRGGGEPETASSRIISSALSSIPGTESSNFASSGSGGMPKVKPNRSLSSGILGGLSRRRSAAMEHQMTTEPVPAMNEFVMQKQISSAKSSQTPPSTRLPNNTSHLLGPSEPKKTTATGLRTPTAVKELRTSPSKPQPKNPAVMSNPINIYASNQPMPLYGQGQASSVPQATHPGMEPRASGSTSGVSPYPPLSPYAALKMYAPYLSLYERAEIGEYPQIYYVGQNCRHKRAASMEASNSNFGFDDERGDYLIINHDHLMFRYEVLDMLGKGSFGQVAKCYDHKTGEYVAIKIIRNKKRFHCQALVEVKILSNLTKWDPEDKHNLIRMTDNFYFRNHLCIATELLSINLYEFIKSNSFQGVSLGLIKRFCTQLLQSLELLNRHNVVHCDLKPENVLLKHPTKSSIKVIDFGSSCLENEKVYTYIQSRFYRSPEVILGMSYNMAIDMWSLGCILAELYTGYPLFPGENEQEQLNCIMEVQGVPDRYIIERCSRRKVFFDSNGNPKLVVNSKGKKRRPGSKTLGQMLKCTDLLFLDFISKCLIWDPEQRMTPHEGLQHEWVSDKGSNKAAFSPVPSDSSGSRRKSSMHSSHSSRKAKSELESKLGLMNSSQTSLKSTRTTASNSNNGSFTYYSGSVPSFGNGSNGTGSNTNNVVKIYGGQQQYQHQPQFQQPQPYMGIYGSSVTSLNSSTSTLSSAASRRMTAGDLGPPAYQHGSRKNATSMYLAGPGGGGVGSHGMD